MRSGLTLQEQWKSTAPSKRKDRPLNEDEEGGNGRRRKGGKRRKKEKKQRHEYEDMEDDQEELDDEDNHTGYREPYHQDNDQVEPEENNPQDLLAAAGLEDSDAEDDAVTLSLSLMQFDSMGNAIYTIFLFRHFCVIL